ncbi:MAG: phosphotransferase, partial [Bacteroidota bacterium]
VLVKKVENLLGKLGDVFFDLLKCASHDGDTTLHDSPEALRSNFRTFILKQARPYVEKYPQIPAPVERAEVEAHFYELIQTHDLLKSLSPELVEHDSEAHLLFLEDLGQSRDFSFLYQKGKQLSLEEAKELASFLSALHFEYSLAYLTPCISNRGMRMLNAEHIFRFPFLLENGFDLDNVQEGLQEISLPYKQDASLKTVLNGLEDRYLSDGNVLLHGDYYPGSWLQTTEGIRIIDPEFCFFGPKEFDVAVARAHLKMAQQEASVWRGFWGTYNRRHELDLKLLDQFTGVEILRRIIGLAQLPLDLELEERTSLLAEAYELIMG